MRHSFVSVPCRYFSQDGGVQQRVGEFEVRVIGIVILCAVVLPLGATRVPSAQAVDPWLRPAMPPAPADNEVTPQRVALGQMLFFDTRLSAKQSMSCASCHNPSLGWSDGRATAVGHDGKILGRASPTILNAAFNTVQMWDGRKATLEEQALGPFGADEQNLPLEELERRVGAISGYVAQFSQAYPGEGVTRTTIAKAIASFERTVLSTESPFDRWRGGDTAAVDAAAQRGFKLFEGKGQCALCHQGFNFTDNGFHNIGLADRGAKPDPGRFAERPIAAARGAFKTPTLRDITLTAPYMHDGQYKTLPEVIDHYDRGGDTRDNLSPNMQPLRLTAAEKRDLIAFLNSLTGDPVTVTMPRLPQ
jgi:cytochrome c peroxidase